MTDKNQQEFDELNFDKQKEIFFKSSYAERADLLLRSQDPVQLANSMSSEEMYLVTRDMDMDMRSEILKYANLPQLFFISDLDCWKKDRITKRGFIDWLRCLEQADFEKLAEWLIRADYEMVVAGLKKFVTVMKPEWEYAIDETLGDKPYFSLDDLYYIQTNEDNFETIKLAFEALYQGARAQYVNIVEGLLSEMDYEMEEEAYRRRQVRLSERGFPETESALQIYRLLEHDEFLKLPRKQIKTAVNENSDVPPAYPVLAAKERLFLDDVLLNLSSEPAETVYSIQEELIWLTNKALACEGIDMASEEKVRHAIERVRRYVNIGLEIESASSVDAARQIVKERWLEFLFRRGFTRLTELRRQFEEIMRRYWGSDKEAFLEFLGDPYELMGAGLLKPQPEFYDGAEKITVDGLRDFKTREEVEETQKVLNVLARLFESLLRLNKNMFKVVSVEADRDDEITPLVRLVGTLFAQFALTGKPVYQHLSKKDILKFFAAAFEANGKKHMLRPDSAERFLAEFMNGKRDGHLEAFLRQILTRVEEDFSGIRGKGVIDPRYINTVRIK